VESPLANAGYSLAGSKANVTDKEIALNGTQTSVNGTIAIPESAGITGTSLVFNAQDASENLLPNNLYSQIPGCLSSIHPRLPEADPVLS
jgi:hypothetical protein